MVSLHGLALPIRLRRFVRWFIVPVILDAGAEFAEKAKHPGPPGGGQVIVIIVVLVRFGGGFDGLRLGRTLPVVLEEAGMHGGAGLGHQFVHLARVHRFNVQYGRSAFSSGPGRPCACGAKARFVRRRGGRRGTGSSSSPPSGGLLGFRGPRRSASRVRALRKSPPTFQRIPDGLSIWARPVVFVLVLILVGLVRRRGLRAALGGR